MAQLNLKPGWLSRDVQKAAQSASELRSKREQTIAAAKKSSEAEEKNQASNSTGKE